jgi:NTE family protein
MKLGLSLSGGGIKGAAHIGAIKALEEENIKFDFISGTSSGSIVATLYACGYTTNEIYNIFNKYAKELKYMDVESIINILKKTLTGKIFNIDGLNSGNKIRKVINQICLEKGISNINQIRMPLLIPAVNICNEEVYVFSNNIRQNKTDDVKYINDVNIGIAVQASCSYPGVFSPCKYEDKLLVDGGIAENLPWRETKRAGADKVLSIVFTDKKPKNCCQNIYEVVNKSFSILCHELAKYEWDGTDYLLKIETEKIGLLDNKKIKELYDEGYIQTKKNIKNIKNKLNI